MSQSKTSGNGSGETRDNVSVLTAYNKIPYALINKEVDGSTSDLFAELGHIMECYEAYKKGVKFNAEGTGNHYVAAKLRYKKAATLIKKEARFLFGVMPDINIVADNDVGKVTQEAKAQLTTYQNLVDKVLEKNMFESILSKAAKDCFIGKRVAMMVNFNEEYGITLQFLPSLNFVYETRFDNSEVLTKFVGFVIIRERSNLSEKRIFKKKFVLETEQDEDGNPVDVCYLEETLHDGTGKEIEVVTEYQPTMLDRIPVAIIINDGLTGETEGESEMDALGGYEEWYSKLSSADIDAGRKGMNAVKYTVDMSPGSTKNLSTAPGSFWDLTSDQNLDKPAPQVGTLESNMTYSGPLDTTLKRIDAAMHDEVDVPNLSLDNMSGVITSGKALKCLYWPLITRCQEKMKVWGPALRYIVEVIIEGAKVYPNCIKKYTSDVLNPVDYKVEVIENYPLPEDEQEEKTLDLAEVDAHTMSRKSYMKKWRQLTDNEIEEELQQIAYELSLVDGTNIEGAATPSDQYDEFGNLVNQSGNGNGDRDTDIVDGTPLDEEGNGDTGLEDEPA